MTKGSFNINGGEEIYFDVPEEAWDDLEKMLRELVEKEGGEWAEES